MTATEHPAHALCTGLAPLTGRTEPWMDRLLDDPDACAALLDEHGSPVNLLDFSPLADGVERLREVASAFGVRLGIYAARKANRALGLVDAALAAGIGLDVASLRELRQSLDAGAAGGDVIVTAAVKDRELLREAIAAGAVISLDNLDELGDAIEEADRLGATARVALRLAVVGGGVAPTRFGLAPDAWRAGLAAAGLLDTEPRDGATLAVHGLHFHLNGYAVADRVRGVEAACAAVPWLREAGHPVSFVDMGGGLPVRYLGDEGEWRAFWRALDDDDGRIGWRGDDLGLRDARADRPSPETYPFWQRLDAAAWMRELLGSPLEDGGSRARDEAGETVAERLRGLDLALHCEPGRALLDGCGLTLARVAFRKETSDGVPLVALFMNRTQLRSTSRDFLVDPILLRPTHHREPGQSFEGFLVGAYCIEEELLMRRRFRFARGVSRDDIAVFVNTGGYLMHILESASHQIPLAANVVRSGGRWRRDRGD